MTGLDARQYRDTYYARPFTFGMGTEHVLALLRRIPPVRTWLDLGCGSESLLWACAIRAEELTAVDLDAERLELLTANADTRRAHGAYHTALVLGDRRPDQWAEVRATLRHVRRADCLHGDLPDTAPVDLVTQFGLLGLCADEEHFRDRVRWMTTLAKPGGCLAGANWMSSRHPERIQLSERLYRQAFANAGADLIELRAVPSKDPDYPTVWTYRATARGIPLPG